MEPSSFDRRTFLRFCAGTAVGLLGCGPQFHDFDIYIVANNRTTDSVEVFINGRSYGIQLPGTQHQYKVKVSVPTYGDPAGPNDQDFASVSVSARNTLTNKSTRTVTFPRAESYHIYPVDFNTNDFAFSVLP